MAYGGKIPFDQHGCPMPYVGYRESGVIWEENKPFHAQLSFVRFERGRSAVRALYVKDDDSTYEAAMFLSDFEKVIQRGLAPQHLTGRFEFVKRGANYGIKLLLIE
jgi:hypothetical protein